MTVIDGLSVRLPLSQQSFQLKIKGITYKTSEQAMVLMMPTWLVGNQKLVGTPGSANIRWLAVKSCGFSHPSQVGSPERIPILVTVYSLLLGKGSPMQCQRRLSSNRTTPTFIEYSWLMVVYQVYTPEVYQHGNLKIRCCKKEIPFGSHDFWRFHSFNPLGCVCVCISIDFGLYLYTIASLWWFEHHLKKSSRKFGVR